MLHIGSLQFDFPVVQAALSGYSDGPMRLIARRFGAPYALHEVVLDKSIVQSPKARRKLLPPLDPADHPIGGQLMGAEPTQFAAAAQILVESGYDAVDINFGCPVKKVLGRCRGGYLLSVPPVAIEIIRAVRDAVPPTIPVTLKLRRGMDDTAESERDFFTILDAAFEHGLDAITVHGRTVKQRYIGRSDWTFLERVKRHAGDRVILGSGDLFSAADIGRMLAQTGVDGVSVARGAIGNPWIFRETRAVLAGQPAPEPPSVPEQGEVIRAHLDLAVAAYGPRTALLCMRKFGIRYADLHPHARQVRLAFATVRTADEWQGVLEKWYDPGREWPASERKADATRLIAAGARAEGS